MKAMVYTRYGPPEVVTVGELAKPVPGPTEVLVRIYATTVTTGDWRARSLRMPPGFGLLGRLAFGVSRPRQPVLGQELAGVVESVGPRVTRFQVGDAVFAFTEVGYGCHAEYRNVPEMGLIAIKPSTLSFGEAAAIGFGGTTALSYLRDKAGIKAGDKVLIVGASGGVGTAAVQVAKHYGATVTGVCSTENLNLVSSLGADHVIDYTREDVAARADLYDIILDTTGTVSFTDWEHQLSQDGRLVMILSTLGQLVGLNGPRKNSRKKVITGVAVAKPGDMHFLANLADAGEFKPHIGASFPLEKAAEAHAYVDTGRKRGNVVLEVSDSRDAAREATRSPA